MTATALAERPNGKAGEVLEKVIIEGDLSRLSAEERTTYMLKVCESLGLNPFTRPFEYRVFDSKLQLYARKDCTEQLRKRDKISVKILSREMVGDIYIVRAHAETPEGRFDEDDGAVFVGGLKGQFLANAMLKATTKSKRRVTLSICGLGFLDETEVADIPEAKDEPVPTLTKEEGKVLAGAMKQAQVLAEELFEAFNIKRLGELPRGSFDQAMAWVYDRKRQLTPPETREPGSDDEE